MVQRAKIVPTARRKTRRSRTARLRRSQSGAGLVEFAVVFPVLMMIFLGIFEFSRHFYTQLTVRHAVAEATRFAVTGNVLNDPVTGDPLSRVESIKKVVMDQAQQLSVDVNNIQVVDGGPEQIVRVSVSFNYVYSLPYLDHLAPIDFTVSTAMRNEPYRP
jgi:Flp pilus assembly protein TadG